MHIVTTTSIKTTINYYYSNDDETYNEIHIIGNVAISCLSAFGCISLLCIILYVTSMYLEYRKKKNREPPYQIEYVPDEYENYVYGINAHLSDSNSDSDSDSDSDNYHIYINKSKKHNNYDNYDSNRAIDNCSICLEKLTGDICKMNNCSHKFHKLCFEQLQKYKINHCPLCNQHFYIESIV